VAQQIPFDKIAGDRRRHRGRDEISVTEAATRENRQARCTGY